MKSTGFFRASTAALAAVALVGSACGGGSSDKTSTPAGGATTAATKPAAAATTAATKSAATAASTARTEVDSLTVTAKDFSFTLNLTSIHPGAPGVDVVFQNSGATTHSFAVYEDSSYTKRIAESQPVAPGGSSGFPFIPPTGATSVFYRCEIHPTQMFGELKVTS
jgi:plastocyanin